MPEKEAIYHRNNFYAFINAWKHEAERVARSKAIPPERKDHLLEHAIRMEDVLRRYICLVEDGELRFVLRGLDERQLSGLAQLEQLLAKNTNPTYDEFKEQLRENPTPTGTATRAGADVVAKFKQMTGTEDFHMENLDTSDTTEEDIAALSNDPPIRDDLSDLITQDNQADSPTLKQYQDMMTRHMTDEKQSKKTS